MAKMLVILVIIVGCVIAAAAIGVLLRHLLVPVLGGLLRGVQFIGRAVIELVLDLLAACWHVVVTILMLPLQVGM